MPLPERKPKYFVHIKQSPDEGKGWYCWGFKQDGRLLYLQDKYGLNYNRFAACIPIENVLYIEQLKGEFRGVRKWEKDKDKSQVNMADKTVQ